MLVFGQANVGVQILDFLQSWQFLEISLLKWGIFIGLALLFSSLIRLALGVIQSRLKSHATQTDTSFDDYALRIVERIRPISVIAAGVLLSVSVVPLRPADQIDFGTVEKVIRSIGLIVLFLQVGWCAMGLLDVALRQGFRFARLNESSAQTAYGVARFFALVALWSSLALTILAVIGIEVTPLLASLGIGGIAVAFAFQQILADIFCSVAIVLDRPFEVGDFIITGDEMGTIEHIGIKTTRVRALSGEQIVMPNSDLIGSRIHNYKRMEERRVLFGFGVVYSTPTQTLSEIPQLVESIITERDQTRFDRAHFKGFGDSSLDFEVVYYVTDPSYNVFMDIQQAINLALFRAFEARRIVFAYPSQSVYLEQINTDVRTKVHLLSSQAIPQPRANANVGAGAGAGTRGVTSTPGGSQAGSDQESTSDSD